MSHDARLPILGMTYFFFGLLNNVTRRIRSIGIYAVYSFVGAGLVSFLLGFTYDFLGMMQYIVVSSAVIVPIGVGVWIIADFFFLSR